MARDFLKLERVLSKSRFDSYKQNVKTEAEAFYLYAWNTMLCESLYVSFQILEVGVRNAIHEEVARVFGDNEWIKNEHAQLLDYEKQAIKEAKISLNKRMVPCDEPHLVAEMHFGFWTSLSDSRYETLWHKIILGVFPNIPKIFKTRAEISKRMSAARKLRNAALHHHSIWHWKDLKHQHHEIRNLIRWICPTLDEMAYNIDRFPKVYRQGSKECARIAGEPLEYEI